MATTAPRTTRVAPRRVARPAPLRVVRPDDRVRAVGTIGTIVAAFFFLVLFALAGLHAVVVQTQAQLDAVNGDIAALEEQRINAMAQRAWFDSPEGLAEAATAAGLVPAAEVVLLPPVAPGLLTGPPTADPFVPGAPPVPPPAGGAGG